MISPSESQRPSLNPSAVFVVINFPHLGSWKFKYVCVLKQCFLGLGMCLSEPQACLSIPTVYSVCLSLGTSGDDSALLFSKRIALPCSLPGNEFKNG